MKMKSCLFVVSLCLISTAYVGHADVTLHPLFSDNMVLQQNLQVPIWGTADPGEKVTVTLEGKSRSTTTNADGSWLVRLDQLSAGGPYTMTVSGNNTLTVKNILLGEVWVCSGQSNMQWTVSNSNNSQEEIENANHPTIRLFYVPRVTSGLPQKTVDATWEVCTPDTIPGFSAVAYFFGRSLQQARNVPIGLIHASWGGTPAEAWTSKESLLEKPDLRHLYDNWENNVKNFDTTLENYIEALKAWNAKAKQIDATGKPTPEAPRIPNDPRRHSWRTSGLYNAMLAPLIPYGIKGAIWYQGESNAGRAYQYRNLFSTMIKDWRKQWGQGELPFFFVQLANYKTGGTWAELREAQNMALKLPYTGMAISIDIGNPTDIHPRNKQDVGARLALAAQGVAYGEDIVYSGPMYSFMGVEKSKVRLRFDHIGSGLSTREHNPLESFTIAGEDQIFVPAKARIDDDTVLVWSDDISTPVAVRYAWEDNPENANLINKEGLPASPFRTDTWPGITINNK